MGRRQPTKDPGNPGGMPGVLFGLIPSKQHSKGAGSPEREVDADRGGPGLPASRGLVTEQLQKLLVTESGKQTGIFSSESPPGPGSVLQLKGKVLSFQNWIDLGLEGTSREGTGNQDQNLLEGMRNEGVCSRDTDRGHSELRGRPTCRTSPSRVDRFRITSAGTLPPPLDHRWGGRGGPGARGVDS